MITRRLGSKAREDVENKRLVLETLKVAEDTGQASAKLVNNADGKIMRLRVYGAEVSDPNYTGSPIYLHDAAILYSRSFYKNREYVCSRFSLVNQNGEELVVTENVSGGDDK